MIRGEPRERVGKYRVVRRLARGSSSDVLLAMAEGPLGFERPVVLKVLLTRFEDDAEPARMFAREAGAYARLSHPSIVQLYDFFAREGQLVMALEYVDGPSLARLVGMLRAEGRVLDDKAALHVGASLFSALATAHAAVGDDGRPAPVIHRDVNPTNVLLPWDGRVKLADFGFSKVGVSEPSRAGLIAGTYGYIAPEQVTSSVVTPRTDVYACGLVLWELLAHRRAFHRGALSDIEALQALSEPHLPPIEVVRPDLPPMIADLLRRALEPREPARITAAEAVGLLRTMVAPDEGRELLAHSLARVRHEPEPRPSSVPPPLPPPSLPSPSPSPKPSYTLQSAAPVMDPAIHGPETMPFPLVTPAGMSPPTPPVPLEPLLYGAEDATPYVGAEVPDSQRTIRLDAAGTPVPAPSMDTVPLAPLPAPQGAAMPSPAAPPARRRGGALVAIFALAGLVVAAGAIVVARGGPATVRADVMRRLAPQEPPKAVETASTPAVTRPPASTTTPAPAPSPAPTPSPAPAPSPAPTPSPSPAPAPSATPAPPTTPAPSPTLSPTQGLIVTTGAAAGRRIFVDGRTVGQTPEPVVVRCGSHVVKLGSAGQERTLDVPCGGQITVARAN